mgnify:CR=1 FL=1
MLTEHGVSIAPRTFYAWATRAPSKRALWDATITEILAGYYEPDEHGRRRPESLYGSLKMWAHLQREGIPVAKSTVERLMRKNGWQGVRRQKRVRTTIPDPEAVRPPDLVDRQFGVAAPNVLLVADFTYVKLVTGVFVYVAFVIDAYARRILGWSVSTTMTSQLVLDAVEQAIWTRGREDRGGDLTGLIAHHDHGAQYMSVAYSERLDTAGIKPSTGLVGSSHDNALTESIIGLYKTELVKRQRPWKGFDDLEIATAEWVDWYNCETAQASAGQGLTPGYN